MKEQLRGALAEVEAKNQQVQRLENESRRWQERNTQLLSKVSTLEITCDEGINDDVCQYDRIDPAEVQTLKDEIETLKSEKTKVDQEASERDQVNASKVYCIFLSTSRRA